MNGGRERSAFRPAAGDVIAVEIPAPERREITAEEIPLAVIYEDDDMLVVDKPAGMVVHPAPGNWSGTLVNALMGRVVELSGAGGAERAGIVHRLDKETSGLLLVAKTDRAHRRLAAAIGARRVAREYAAVIWGHLAADTVTVDRPIGRDPRDRKRMAIVPDGKPARTDLYRVARFRSTDLVRAHLHSGRTHQIRVHTASLGHPVVGDDVYGGGGGRRLAALPPRRHFLHAARLRLRHPVSGAPLDFRSPLPGELRRSLVALGEPYVLPDDDDPLDTLGFYDDRATGGTGTRSALR